MKQLIICPMCEIKGDKQVLGELADDEFLVLRFHKGVTAIKGIEFSVKCGSCNEFVYIRSQKR